MSEFNRQGFEKFLAGLGYDLENDNSIQELLRYYCLHGVKENEFAAILAFYLQRYLRSNDEKFTVVLNSSLPQHFGKLVQFLSREANDILKLTTYDKSDVSLIDKVVGATKDGKKGRTFADIQVLGPSHQPQHIIELKSDRCEKYLSELLPDNKLSKPPKDGCIEGLITDLKILASLQAWEVYEESTFWQGVLVYSFHQVGGPLPTGFPKYIGDESRANEEKRKIPVVDNDEEKRWFEICSVEVEDLGKKLLSFLSKQDFLVPPKTIHRIKVAQGGVHLHDEINSSKGQVIVHSELLLFEVIAQEEYLKSIAEPISRRYKEIFQRGN